MTSGAPLPPFGERLVQANSAEHNVKDMIYVGWCYLYGEGTLRDVPEGINWLKRAAGLGSAEAQVRLAEIYELGELVPVDCDEAKKWFAKALESNEFFGHYALGVAHFFGSRCSPQNISAAYMHFLTAARAGHLVSKFQAANLLKSGRFGFMQRIRGHVMAATALCQTAWIILTGKSGNQLWDAQRWLSNMPQLVRLRRGTRFE